MDIKPQVSWGTSPEMVVAVDGAVPDPETFTEIEILYPQNEWESYQLALNSITSADTIVYFAWRLASESETSFHLDNVFVHKEELEMYVYLCSCNYSMYLPLPIILCKNLFSFLKTNISAPAIKTAKNNLRSCLGTSHKVFPPSPCGFTNLSCSTIFT